MVSPRDATSYTQQANTAAANDSMLNWQDQLDFDFARRGFVARLAEPVIRTADGRVVWDLESYGFLDAEQAPPTVNPSLWRMARLNMLHGLFQVTARVYQVRGYDLSVISFIRGDTGWIVIDPLVSAETAKASLELLYENVERLPVVAVIYTHSHLDHYGGVRGVANEEDVKAGKIQIIAPAGFLEHAISENVLAGNAMGRRAVYMYGVTLPPDPKGKVDAGLGKTLSSGTVTLLAPTQTIDKTEQTLTVDGVEIIFQVTPGTEAPAEMNFYFPQFKALCMAENCTHTLHNLYSLRGAQVRDAKAWAYYLEESIELFGEPLEVMFASHHWPVWGRERAIEQIKKQRDMYKYLHDQTLRLANHGYTMLEIAEQMELPPALAKEWYNRGYYGSISHDVKAVYQKYLGFYDGNPANLHPHPPQAAAKKYVEYMGGAEAVLAQARRDFEAGDYRWVAEVVNHVVFADPENVAARELQAEALEQLGYQAESAPWRNVYLMGALELRNGIPEIAGATEASPDVLSAMPLEMLFDYLSVQLNGPKAIGKTITINWHLTDTDEKYILTLENSVLNYYKGKQAPDADVSFALTHAALIQMVTGSAKPADMVAAGQIQIQGDPQKLAELMALTDHFLFWFNIVTP